MNGQFSQAVPPLIASDITQRNIVATDNISARKAFVVPVQVSGGDDTKLVGPPGALVIDKSATKFTLKLKVDDEDGTWFVVAEHTYT